MNEPNLPIDEERAELRRLRNFIAITVEACIDLLDQIDGDPDLEPSLGGNGPGYAVDAEGDDSEDEPSLGWAHSASQLRLGQGTEDGDETALERHGAGFLRSGGDDSEDSHDAEATNEDGGDINDECHDGELDRGEQDDSDLEPSLGAPEPVLGAFACYDGHIGRVVLSSSQEHWAAGTTDDRELEDEREPEDWL